MPVQILIDEVTIYDILEKLLIHIFVIRDLNWKESMGKALKEMSFENIDKFKLNLISDTNARELDWPLQRCLSLETELIAFSPSASK